MTPLKVPKKKNQQNFRSHFSTVRELQQAVHPETASQSITYSLKEPDSHLDLSELFEETSQSKAPVGPALSNIYGFNTTTDTGENSINKAPKQHPIVTTAGPKDGIAALSVKVFEEELIIRLISAKHPSSSWPRSSKMRNRTGVYTPRFDALENIRICRHSLLQVNLKNH